MVLTYESNPIQAVVEAAVKPGCPAPWAAFREQALGGWARLLWIPRFVDSPCFRSIAPHIGVHRGARSPRRPHRRCRNKGSLVRSPHICISIAYAATEG